MYKVKIYKATPEIAEPTHRGWWYWDVVMVDLLRHWEPGDPKRVAVATGARRFHHSAIKAALRDLQGAV